MANHLPIRVSRRFVRVSHGTYTTISRARHRLARVSVPGYGPFFKSVDRSLLLEGGSFDLNIHPIIAMHEEFYPKDQKNILPTGLAELQRLENKTPDFIANPKYQAGFGSVPSSIQPFLFESAIPVYLISDAEEIFIPSAGQLGDMLTYYRQILGGVGTRGVFPYEYFAQQMSAVSNLGLFGSVEDAQYILRVARTDFGAFDDFKDLFITRALLNLEAYNELQTLADIRLAEKDSNKEPKDLSAVWIGVQTLVRQNGQRLTIPQERIRAAVDSCPEFLQKQIIAHHPFNYVLSNPSLEVTEDWWNLRVGINELFARARAQEVEKEVTAQVLQTLTVSHLPVQHIPVTQSSVPPRASEPQAPQEVVPEVPAEDPVEAVTPLPEVTSPVPNVVKKERKKREPKPTISPVVPKPAKRKTQAKADLPAAGTAHQTLLDVTSYLSTYTLLPRKLRKRAQYACQTGNPDDPDVQALTQLLADHSQHSRRTPKTVRAELEREIAKLHRLPVSGTRVRRRAEQVRETGDPNDPDVQAIIALLTQHAIQGKRDPYNLRRDLEEYLRNNNGQYPPVKDPMMIAIPRVLRENKGSKEEDVQVLRQLWQQHLAHVRDEARQRIKQNNPGRFTQVAQRALSPKQLHEGILQYMADNGGKIPPQHHYLRSAAEYRLGLGETQDADLLAIRDIFAVNKRAHTKRTPSQVRTDLEKHLRENNDQMPLHGSGLDQAIKFMFKRYPDDPDTQKIRAIVEAHRKHKSVSPKKRSAGQLFDDLTEYLATNEYSPHKGALYQAINKIMRRGTPLTEQENALIELWKSHRSKEAHSPEQVHRALQEEVDKGTRTLPTGTALYHAARAVLKTGDLSDPHVHAVAEIWRYYGLKMPKRQEK